MAEPEPVPLRRCLSQAPDPVELVRAESALAKQAVAASKGLQPPTLVRGLTSTAVNDDAALTRLVHQAMAEYPDWAAVGAEDLAVKDVSGLGGAKTFKVYPKSEDAKLSPPAVALHSRPPNTEHGFMKSSPGALQLFMRRMSAATQAVAAGGAGPARLAEGSDWFVEAWGAKGRPDTSSPEGWGRVGRLLAAVHKVPVDWFEPFREEIIADEPCAAGALADSPAWLFLSRCCKFNALGDPAVFAEWAQMGPIGATHPAGQRTVTCHGDFHPGNIIEYEGGKLEVVDFEFTCVTTSILDLAFGVACCGDNDGHRRAFIAAYLEDMGHVADDSAIQQLLVDSYLGMLYLWHSGGVLAALNTWDDKAELLDLVQRSKQFAQDVRDSPKLQQSLLDRRLGKTKSEHPSFSMASKLLRSKWYQQVQAALDEAVDEVAEGSAVDAAEAFVLKPHGDTNLALQVRPGTCRLELQEVDGTQNQAWIVVGHHAMACFTGAQLQHVGTGLCLDTEVKYCHYTAGKEWESAGTELFVRPPDVESASQRWSVEYTEEGIMIRHSIDGRALDVNFWQPAAGKGVNVTVAHTSMAGQTWVRRPLADPAASAPAPLPPAEHFAALRATGSVYQCWLIDKLETKEKFIQHDYPDGTCELYALDGETAFLCGSFTMLDGVYTSRFTDFEAHGELCGGAEGFHMDLACKHGPHRYTGMSDVFDCGVRRELDASQLEELGRRRTPAAVHPDEGTKAWKAPPSVPILDLPEGTEFLIQPGACRFTCLAVRSEGYMKDPYEVFLQKVDGSAAQKWRLVGADTFQHVESGRFLHSFTKYAHVHHSGAPWEGNHTHLVTRPQDFSDQQRWVLGPEEYHGGQVLRHFMDGRGVDVHGWQVGNDGNNMGCENSVHGDCKGVSYVFTPVSAQ